MIEQLEIIKILNMIEAPQTSKEYTYNKMPCINSKPSLQRGNENLLEYNITLPLHFSFCNPKNVIKTLEEFAEQGTPFDWVYKKEYMGLFLIDKIEKKLIGKMKDTLYFAEVSFNLLEVPVDPNFEAQIEGNGILDEMDFVDEKSPEIKKLSEKIKESAVESFKANVQTALLNNSLTDIAKEITRTVAGDVMQNLSGLNVANIYNTVNSYTDSIKSGNLNPIDTLQAVQTISAIPNMMLNGALR